ncbi:alkaline phosphatase D family protein [Azospirillum argentinense]
MPTLGPVLAFCGADSNKWCLSALVVDSHDPGQLVLANDMAVDAKPLWSLDGRTAWAYRFSIPLTDKHQKIAYRVAGVTAEIDLPASGAAPSAAYGSCNGFSDPSLMKNVPRKNAMWEAMAERHALKPYNLLLLGGDQVYADTMWLTLPTMKAWAQLGWKDANKAAFTPTMEKQLNRFYFDLYVERWSQPEIAAMLRSIPTLCMFDDHDLVDGYGSYPKERQECDVFKGLGRIARHAFAVFQQQINPLSETVHGAIGGPSVFSRGHTIGPIAILAVDLRSERTTEQVMTRSHWDLVFNWIGKLRKEEVKHLLLMSSIPVVYPGFDTIERALGMIPGQQELEDDLRDHWNSRPHKGERLRLIHRLLELAGRGIRPTIISGDVHVGAVGVIESTRSGQASGPASEVVNQLISSGIVHPGPGGMVLYALRNLLDHVDEIDRGIIARMTKFPGTPTEFIGGRNFLSLEPDAQHRIWCNWIVEHEAHPYVKVVHPLEP